MNHHGYLNWQRPVRLSTHTTGRCERGFRIHFVEATAENKVIPSNIVVRVNFIKIVRYIRRMYQLLPNTHRARNVDSSCMGR